MALGVDSPAGATANRAGTGSVAFCRPSAEKIRIDGSTSELTTKSPSGSTARPSLSAVSPVYGAPSGAFSTTGWGSGSGSERSR